MIAWEWLLIALNVGAAVGFVFGLLAGTNSRTWARIVEWIDNARIKAAL